MALWNDFYYRAFFEDKGEVPLVTSKSVYRSPDIIPRETPLDNPSSLIDTNWNTDLGQNLTYNMNGRVYLRGANNNPNAPSNVKLSLYYTPSNILLFPSLWEKNRLKTALGKDVCEITVAANGKGYTNQDDCFIWKPTVLSPQAGHYCLISHCQTAGHPEDIPTVLGVNDLAEFVCKNRNYGWRNITVDSKNVPTGSYPVAYSQGNEGGTMRVLIECTNFPAGSEVGFDCPQGGTNIPIHLAKTKIPESDKAYTFGIPVDIPANWTGEITYSFWLNGKKPNPAKELKIDLKVVFFTDSSSPIFSLLKTPEELGFPRELSHSLRLGNSIGPTRGLVLGSNSTVLK